MQFSPNRKNVELHLHFDGALRPKTLFEEAERRGIRLPYATGEAMAEALWLKEPTSLPKVLEKFDIYLPILVGDKEVLSRCAWEFMEDCVKKSSLAYVEARFAPHLFASNALDADAVTLTLLEAMQRASAEFQLGFGVILCNLLLNPEVAGELFQIALKYKNHGVVGIDLAGDETVWSDGSIHSQVVKCYDQAKVHGIHRTVHAGEAGSWRNVKYAIETLHAERIGHGYRVLQNEELYANLLETNMHFELCPTSSILTGSVPVATATRGGHPLNRLARDNANYSVNTDDPLLTGRWLMEEHRYCQNDLGWPSDGIAKSRINAAKSAFIDDEEDRSRLIQHVSGKSDDASLHKQAVNH